ncbi:MAG: response regulator [Bacteroidia bacterium]|nr:response regulator [Bacteroidia bacterium]
MNGAKKILVADDEPNILLSLEFLMRKSGYEVFIARNGSEAMEIVKKHNPALAVLDIMMPDIDGYQICSFIKNSVEHKACKVIFLSAKSKDADIQKGMEFGADYYMTKPYSTRALMQKVNDMLQA